MDPISTRIALGASGSAGGASVTDVVLPINPSPYINAYPWADATGFGTRYADPSTALPTQGLCANFSPSGKAVFVTCRTFQCLRAYAFSATGFGTQYANPVGLDGNGWPTEIAVSNSGNAVIVSYVSGAYAYAFPWSDTTGFGTKYADPSPPQSSYWKVCFSPTDSHVAFSNDSSPYIHVYSWSGSGFGTKVANPSPLPSGQANSARFSPDSGALVIGLYGSPYLIAYAWTGSAFGTKYSDPSVSPGSIVWDVHFSPDGKDVAISTFSSPYIQVYRWDNSTGFGTKYSNPTTLPAGDSRAVRFSPSGKAIFNGQDAWAFTSGVGFGAKYTRPPGWNDNNGTFNFKPVT